jgi:hypothetical protein
VIVRAHVRRQLRVRYWFSDREIEELGLDSVADGQRYISQRAYQALRPWLDDPAWNEVLRNKWLTRQYFEVSQLPHPKTLGYLSATCGFGEGPWRGFALRSGLDLIRALRTSGEQAIALKHVTSGVGNGVFLCNYDGEQLRLRNGETLSPARIDDLLRASSDGYLVERSVAAAPELRALIGHRLHSVGVQTFRRRDGTACVHFAYLRVGLPQALTDHASVGGVMYPIELEDGALGDAMGRPGATSPTTSSGSATFSPLVLRGFRVPAWDQVKRLSLEAALSLPRVRWVGWDILCAPDGAVIIEGNVGNPMALYQRLAGPFAENGILTDWAREWGAPLPDGSVRWRLRHRYVGRRLAPWEQLVAPLVARVSGYRAP